MLINGSQANGHKLQISNFVTSSSVTANGQLKTIFLQFAFKNSRAKPNQLMFGHEREKLFKQKHFTQKVKGKHP